MKPEKYILIVLIILFIQDIKCQDIIPKYRQWNGIVFGVHEYTTPLPFPNNGIADDYGPRQLSASVPYDWHGGIDYNSNNNDGNNDLGDILLALEDGTVNLHGPDQTGTKWITIAGVSNFTYVHIFVGGSIPTTGGLDAGGCTLKRMDSPNQQKWTIIFKDSGQYSAIGPVAGNVTFLKEDGTSATIPVINTVIQDAPIAALGTSNNFAAHAHLQKMVNLENSGKPIFPWNDSNSKNPLNEISHNTPSYDIILSQQSVQSGIDPVYPGTMRTPLKARVSLQNESGKRYSSGIMDIENVEFKVDHLNDNKGYFNISGSSFNGIKYGGSNNSPKMPINLTTRGIGNWNKTGVHPSAYYDDPYDDFYFDDFFTRIHKDDPMDGGNIDIANYPWDSRFYDGNYTIKTSVTSLTSAQINTQESQPINFDIDNFKPFIQRAEVYVEGPNPNIPVYQCAWEAHQAPNSSIKLDTRKERGIENIANAGNLVVYGIASEALDAATVTAEIPSLSTGEISGTLEPNTAGKKWKFNFGDDLPLQFNTCYKIIFRGKDLNGNELLDFTINNPVDCNWGITTIGTIPKRNGASSWDATTPSGLDEVHRFQIKRCGSGPVGESSSPCLEPDQVTADVHNATSGQSDGSIHLAISGNLSGILITWYDLNHNFITNGSLTNIPAGWYCYEILDECCVLSECIEVGTCELDVATEVKHPVDGQSNGIITLTVTDGAEPYKYSWSNSATTNPVIDLSPGIYTVTVEDDFHCTLELQVVLHDCPEIDVDITSTLTSPTSCDINNGGIYHHQTTVSGGTAPYSYHWEDSEGNILSSTSNLFWGEYCQVATDANGCVGKACVSLLPEHYPEFALEAIESSCINNPVGSIALLINDPEGGNYFIDWDNGQQDYGDLSILTDLYPGTHCVTITSEVTDCPVVKCYEVPLTEPDEPLVVQTSSTMPCPGQGNGTIHLSVAGGSPPYKFDWADINDYYEPEDRTYLPAGFYMVTVSDYCGLSSIKTFSLLPVSITNLYAAPNCQGQGQAFVQASGGNPPYTYLWSNAGTSTFISNLNSGNYCVTVTDVQGCTVSQCVYLQNMDIIQTEIIKPCDGLGQTGSVTYIIHNPLNLNISVFNEGIPVVPFSTETELEVVIDQLSANTNYLITINIGECSKQIVVNIPPHPTNDVFNHYDAASGKCVNDIYCNGEIVQTNGSNEDPRLDFANSKSFPCSVERFCSNQSIGWMGMETKVVRAMEYALVLNAALLGGFEPAHVNKLINEFTAEGMDNCDKVRYCTANLEITSTSFPENVFNGDGTVTYINTNCYGLECGWFYDNTLCYDEVIPQWWNPDNYDYESCDPRRYNAWQLIVWFDQLKDTYPDFENTELGIQIKQLHDIYYGIIPFPDPVARVLCVFVHTTGHF